jgi:hypothetical protein
VAEVEPTQGRWRYEFVAHLPAPVEEVWPLLGEASRWKDWSFLTRAFLLREGTPVPDGVGALRRFAVGAFGSTEEVVVFDAPRHLGYVGHKGLPVRLYRADVLLTDEDGGTRLVWTGKVEPKIPGTGAMTLAFLRSFVRRFIAGLSAYVARGSTAA